MEHPIYVQPRRSEPQVVTVRDDGYVYTSASEAPSATAKLIGQCGEFLCFQDSGRFYIWNSTSKSIERQVGFDMVQPQESVTGFGKTVGGDWRIVILGKDGNLETRIYRSENDGRVANGNQEAVEGAVPDGWDAWPTFVQYHGQDQAFKPSRFQLARFSVSEDDQGAIYWAGKVGNVARMVRFSIATEQVSIMSPPLENISVVTIGHGFNGELAATIVQNQHGIYSLHAWSRRGHEWVPIATVLLEHHQVAVSFIPLCFFNGRVDLDNGLNLLFLKDGLNIIRMRPNHVRAASEELFTSTSQIRASTLPSQRYPYLMTSFEKHRTPEEDEEQRAQKRRRMSRTICFDSFNPDSNG